MVGAFVDAGDVIDFGSLIPKQQRGRICGFRGSAAFVLESFPDVSVCLACVIGGVQAVGLRWDAHSPASLTQHYPLDPTYDYFSFLPPALHILCLLLRRGVSVTLPRSYLP